MPTVPGRTAHAQAILGPDLHAQLSCTKVLLVGAGGIGCELLKNIVLTGFGNITILDLDTIDLSNLNRQFLFRKKDVKQSKALIAAQTAAPFNPNVKITPIHGNIKEHQYDVEWFKQFDIVLNALDNLDARRHVNKMCMAGDIPLVESGTAGYLGQVQPLLKDRTECFDCVPKPTPKTFPVCTIRSTPSQPIHCIVWSKSYLMGQLFGEDEDAVGELDEAEKQGENAQEIETLRKEAQAFKAVRHALRTPSPNGSSDVAKVVFDKVFNADIKNLLIMADMWKARQPPTPLDFDAIMGGTFVHRPGTVVNGTTPNGNVSSSTPSTSSGSSGLNGESSQNVLRDQRKLSLKEDLELFVSSTNRLGSRLQNGEDTISFDKDDDDTLDFVTASSNLRSVAYAIEEKTRWEVKEMAGNIIPAIATTNAIVSGLIVLQALHLLRKSYNKLRNIHLQLKPSVPLSSITLSEPNPNCGICRDTYAVLQCDPARATLGEVVKGLLGDDNERDVSVYEDKRVLSDPDWDENHERTLESLNVTSGKFLTIVDEEGERETIAVNLCPLPPNHLIDAPPFILPNPLPQPSKRIKPKASVTPQTPPRLTIENFPEDENGVIEIDPTPRRPVTKVLGGPRLSRKREHSVSQQQSPSKKRRLDEDGLVMLDGENDLMMDDVIVIDDD